MTISFTPFWVLLLASLLGESLAVKEKKSGTPNTLKTVAMVLVLLVWASNMLLDAFLANDYNPSPFVHGAMMMVLGHLLGIRVGGGGNSE